MSSTLKNFSIKVGDTVTFPHMETRWERLKMLFDFKPRLFDEYKIVIISGPR